MPSNQVTYQQAPNPFAAAQAQVGSNIDTAIANTYLGNASETSPWGSVNYTRTGTERVGDKDVPQFRREVNLSSGQQNLANQQEQIASSLNNTAIGQIGRISNTLNTPVDLGQLPASANSIGSSPDYQNWGNAPSLAQGYGGAGTTLFDGGNYQGQQFGFADVGGPQRGVHQNFTSGQIADVGGPQRNIGPRDYEGARRSVEEAIYSRLNPQIERDRAALETNLVNQGFQRGTEGFRTAMDEANRSATDARMQAVLAGGQEQSRLAGLDVQQGEFANRAQQQAFGQASARTQAQMAADAANNAALMGTGQFANQAQATAYQQALGRGQFANQAAAQDLQNRIAQNAAMNASGQMSRDEAMQRTTFGNTAAQQAWENANAQIEANNRVAQNRFATNIEQANFANTARERALQEQLAARNQGINEISALMSGGQVTAPSFTQYRPGQVASTPTGDYIYRSADLNAQNQRAQNQVNAQTSGALWNLAGSLGSAGIMRMSDRRIKRDIVLLGQLRPGIGWYAFRYLNDNVPRQGVMADEVEAVMPEAVYNLGGIKAVNYSLLGAA